MCSRLSGGCAFFGYKHEIILEAKKRVSKNKNARYIIKTNSKLIETLESIGLTSADTNTLKTYEIMQELNLGDYAKAKKVTEILNK